MKIFLLLLLIVVIKSALIKKDTVESKKQFSDLERKLDFDIEAADAGPAKVNTKII